MAMYSIRILLTISALADNSAVDRFEYWVVYLNGEYITPNFATVQDALHYIVVNGQEECYWIYQIIKENTSTEPSSPNVKVSWQGNLTFARQVYYLAKVNP
jgi:hypothetical protein